MPPLSIPRRYRVGLAAVDSLSEGDVNLLVERLRIAESEVSFEELAASVSDEVSADVDLARLLEGVASLNTLLPEDGSGADSLAQDVSESEDLNLPGDSRPAYAARLATLIRIPVLVSTARAMEVVAEHDKVFHAARILTDVRPVFGPDPSTGVKMAAVVATMKLEYHPGGRSAIESVFVALDRGDLEHLRDVLDRALTKMDSLSRLMKESDVPRWTRTYHDHG